MHLLNVARSWCVLALRRNIRLNSLSPLGTNRFVIRLRCSEKLSADLHLLSACTFVALRTQQIGIIRQPVFPNQFSEICEIGRIRRKCPFPDRFHRPPQTAQQQNEYYSRYRLNTPNKHIISSKLLNRLTCVGYIHLLGCRWRQETYLDETCHVTIALFPSLKSLHRIVGCVYILVLQLFRRDINTAHFYFLLRKFCQITRLVTRWKQFLYHRRRPLWGRWNLPHGYSGTGSGKSQLTCCVYVVDYPASSVRLVAFLQGSAATLFR